MDSSPIGLALLSTSWFYGTLTALFDVEHPGIDIQDRQRLPILVVQRYVPFGEPEMESNTAMYILPIDGIDKDECSVGKDCMKKVSLDLLR